MNALTDLSAIIFGPAGILRILPITLVFIYFIGLHSAYTETIPVTERPQFVTQNPHQLEVLAVSAYLRALNGSKIIEHGQDARRVQQVGARIANAANSYMEKLTWRFILVDSPKVNVVAFPSGDIIIFRGILPIAKNENGLAAILAHEIAHMIAHHHDTRLIQLRRRHYGTLSNSVALDNSPTMQAIATRVFGASLQPHLRQPFSAAHEYEANYIGLHILATACYELTEVEQFWRRLIQADQHTSTMLALHPYQSSAPNVLKREYAKLGKILIQSCRKLL